jgi:hypothetical protein
MPSDPQTTKSLTEQLTEINQEFNKRIVASLYKQALQSKSFWDQILKNQEEKQS